MKHKYANCCLVNCSSVCCYVLLIHWIHCTIAPAPCFNFLDPFSWPPTWDLYIFNFPLALKLEWTIDFYFYIIQHYLEISPWLAVFTNILCVLFSFKRTTSCVVLLEFVHVYHLLWAYPYILSFPPNDPSAPTLPPDFIHILYLYFIDNPLSPFCVAHRNMAMLHSLGHGQP